MEENSPVIRANGDEINLITLILTVWKWRWLVLSTTLLVTLAGVGVALLLPKTYEATATVFPVSSSGASGLSEYSGLAALAGINLSSSGGGNNPAKTVGALLSSRLLAERLVVELNLLEQFPPSRGETVEAHERRLVDSLRKSIKSKEDPKTGVMSLSVELGDPELAQRMANQTLTVLDELLSEKSFTTNKKKREQLERQIQEREKKLTEIQQQMAAFQTQTALLDPKTQPEKVVDAYTKMVQQRMDLELQLATAQASYSADNPRITQLKTQLRSLETQIETVKNEVGGDLPSVKLAPENMIRYQNLTRDLEIATKIYATLLANLEQSKLENDKDQVYLEVLDRALLPENGKPSRTMVVILAGVVGFLASLLIVLLLEWTKTLREWKRPNRPDTSE